MGKFKPKTFGLTLLGISTVIIALLIGVDGDGALGANLGLPTLDITEDQFGNRIVTNSETQEKLLILEEFNIPNIACWVSQTVIVRGEDGGAIGSSKSPFFKSNPFIATPTFSVIDTETGKSLVGGSYTTKPEIKCSTGKILVQNIEGSVSVSPEGEIDPEGAFDILFPSFEVPLTVSDSFFTIRVYAQLPNNTWKEVFNAPYKIDMFDITDPKRVFLPSYKIEQEWLQRFLPDGDYQTTLKIVYDGAVVMHWKQTSLCPIQCSELNFVIPFVTERTFVEGKEFATDVRNPFEINRLVTLGIIGNGEDPPDVECDGIRESVDPDTGVCIPIPFNEQPCPEGQVKFEDKVCVTITDTGGSGGNGNSENPTVDPNNTILLLSTCISSGDPSCLASSNFLPFWIFGIGGIVVIGALAQRKQPQIYGVPTGGF